MVPSYCSDAEPATILRFTTAALDLQREQIARLKAETG